MQVKALLKYLPHHIKVHLFHAPHPHIFMRTLWCLWVIPQVLLANRHTPFALIHAHAYAAGVPGKILSALLNIPIVYTVHGSHLMDSHATGLTSVLERWLLTSIRYTHQISVTKSFLQYPNVNKNISFINNGVDISVFNKVKIKKNKKITLLYVGRDHPTKGLDVLRAAFTLAKKHYPDIKLQIVTKLTGQKLIRSYKQAHAFVLPSLVEGQPLVLLEAWAAKLPVIATRTAGVIEIATAKEAILIPPGDIKSLHQAILKLLRLSPRQRLNLATNGYSKARGFTWEKTARHTAAIYEQVTHS